MNYDRIQQQAGHLPAFQIADAINSTLKESANLVVTAPPGAGKSTVLPLTLLEATPQGRILMLEPRRLAARQIAERMASILGEPVGKTVGYRVRFENKVSSETRIEVLTEGILTRMLIHDATLEGVSAVIFDEFHERSINSDLALALTRQGMDLFASPHLPLQVGDRVMVVGPEDLVNRVADVLGNSIKRLDAPNIATIFIGILVGIIFGSLPIAIPGMPVPLKLGIAGGPLIIAILIGRYGYKIRLVTYTTTSANMMLREIGLVLFLASVGIKAGAGFWDTVVQGDGLKYVYTGFIITVIPILIIGTLARLKFKFNYFTIMGMIAGTYTDPPALAYANQICSKEAPAIGYSTVYPLSMFLRILAAQLTILLACGG